MKQRQNNKRKSNTKLSERDKQPSLLHFFSLDRNEKRGAKQINTKKYLPNASCMDVSSPCSLSQIGILDSSQKLNKGTHRNSQSTKKKLLSSFYSSPVHRNDYAYDIDKKRQILEGNLRLRDLKNYKDSQVPYFSPNKVKKNNSHSQKDSLAQFENHQRTDSLGSCFFNTKNNEHELTSSILDNSDFPKDSLARSPGVKIIGKGVKPNLKKNSNVDSEEVEQYFPISRLDNNESPKDSLATSSNNTEVDSIYRQRQVMINFQTNIESKEQDAKSSSSSDISINVNINSNSDSYYSASDNISNSNSESISTSNSDSDNISNNNSNNNRNRNSNRTSDSFSNSYSSKDNQVNFIPNDDDDHNDGTRKLSEYEKLRLRNIARNEARMASLGLTVISKEKPKKPPTKRIPKKVPPKVKNSLSNLPTRRSTRVRNKGLVEYFPSTLEDEVVPEIVIEQKDLPEEYTVSPLVQYSMMDQNNASHEKAMLYDVEKISLKPYRHQCLRPPSRLDAIYSLNFCPSNDSLLVGAGKAGIVALWDLEKDDPIMTWKAHSGRWIATAQFVDTSKLLTAGNDGCVCLWDLTSTSVKTETPKMLVKTNKILHKSGIFSMHCMDQVVATASKDKSIAITSLESMDREPIWRSTFHSSKVSSVCLQNDMVASSSDDGTIAIHDYRSSDQVPPIVLEDVHIRPHSAIWDHNNCHNLLTAGLDDVLKIWDTRKISSPILSLNGHVPLRTKMKKIQRPLFYQKDFILTGGEKSGSLSMFRSSKNELISRGSLPDGSDVGSLASHRDRVAVSLQGGEVLLLHTCHENSVKDEL